MIRFEGVTYRYPQGAGEDLAPALCDIDLDVPAGQWWLIAGPSGCGKSTLLRCLNGLVPHFHGGRIAGRLRVANLDPVAEGPRAMSEHVGFLFQDPEAQFITQRVEDEVALVLESHAVAPREIAHRLDETFDTLAIRHLRFRRIASLSGGERQKVALASLWSLRPRILVLDEPTSQIDPASALEIFEALDRLQRDHGVTVVLSEHRLQPLMKRIDRVVLLNRQGRIERVGEPAPTLTGTAFAPPVLQLAEHNRWTTPPLTLAEAHRRYRRSSHERDKREPSTRVVSPPSEPPLLEAQDLSYRYPGASRLAVETVTLALAAGERCALVGRNGSGKSTLIKLLVGLLRPGEGSVRLGESSHRQRPLDEIGREVGLVPQNPSRLLFTESVAQEIETTRRARGLAENATARDDLLRELGLSSLADRHPRDLSGGERQRTALAAVLAGEPRILLLDEPTRGLDAVSEAAMVESLRRRTTPAGSMAVVLVTHDLELVARFATRLVLLENGEKIADGPVGEVMGRFPEFASFAYRLAGDPSRLTVEALLEDG
ncbi:MAG: ATP-binding cassette domain-containing protein [Acidobacteriota bacterium]